MRTLGIPSFAKALASSQVLNVFPSEKFKTIRIKKFLKANILPRQLIYNSTDRRNGA